MSDALAPSGGLVVDDHTFMRSAMRSCLDELGISPVREGLGLSDGRLLVAEHTPEIAILDLRLDDGSSLELVSSLKFDGAKVLVLSSADDGYSVRSAYAAGAMGYLMKSAPREMVMHGLREIRAGRIFADPSVSRLLVHGVQESPDQDLRPLTDRELEVLRLVADGLSNNEIADKVAIPALSVKGHLAKISRKLGVGDRTQMVAAAMRADLLR